jgi:hypothetical protein
MKPRTALQLAGQRFGRLVAQEVADKDLRGNVRWLCRCDCGEQRAVPASELARGGTRSCGCLRAEASRERLALYRPRRFMKAAHA